MADERVKEYYMGFQLVSAFYRGEYQAKAHHKHADALEARNCNSISEAQNKIKARVEAYIAEHKQELQAKVTSMHERVMMEAGHKYSGVNSVTSFHRINHCYSCKRPVDNAFDVECGTCNWIVCSTCGSCGCGFS